MDEHSPNAALTRRIEQQLAEAGLLVAVEFSDGSLILNGTVPSHEAKENAEDIVRNVAPGLTIDNQVDVESRLPTDVDDFVSEEPPAELAATRDEIERQGGELEADFTDQPGLFDPIAAAGAESSNEDDLVSETGETYTPPTEIGRASCR